MVSALMLKGLQKHSYKFVFESLNLNMLEECSGLCESFEFTFL